MTEKQQERNKLFFDIYSGKRPDRVPTTIVMNIEAAMEYLGYTITRDLYSPQLCFEAADKMAQLIDTDTLPVSPSTTPGAIFRYIDSKFMVAGADGFFQHPDFAPMKFEEYPEYTEDTLGFIVDKIHPRVFGIYDEDPILAHVRIKTARQVVASLFAGMNPKLINKYEKADCMTTSGMFWAPFDFIADYIRSFSTLMVDMRKNPQYVSDATDATLNFELDCVDRFAKPLPDKLNEVFMPLHMAPYMRPKDVEKFYWPSYKKLVEYAGKKGYTPNVFYEGNWTPHMDLLQDLDVRHVAKFEYVDYETVANKTPENFILMCSYPMTMIRNSSKQECIDEAKRCLDVLAKDGRYIFAPNKRFIRKGDFNIENLQAIYSFVNEYGKY